MPKILGVARPFVSAKIPAFCSEKSERGTPTPTCPTGGSPKCPCPWLRSVGAGVDGPGPGGRFRVRTASSWRGLSFGLLVGSHRLRYAASRLIGGREVRCEARYRDRYGRTVALLMDAAAGLEPATSLPVQCNRRIVVRRKQGALSSELRRVIVSIVVVFHQPEPWPPSPGPLLALGFVPRFFLQLLQGERSGGLNQTIKMIPVRFAPVSGNTSLFPPNKTCLFEGGNMALDGAWCNLHRLRDALLGRMRFVIVRPPVVRQVEQDVHINGIKAKRLLTFNDDARDYRPTSIHQRL